LQGADLSNATLTGANLEEANFSGALLSDADLSGAKAAKANFSQATLLRCNLEQVDLGGATMSGADLRHANLTGAKLTFLTLSGARLAKATLLDVDFTTVIADTIDVSEQGDQSEVLSGSRIAGFFSGKVEAETDGTRYFGRGDVLRDALLEFGANSSIHIDSRFENCSLTLGEGAELVIGDSGVLKDCQIQGNGNITIHGRFFERQAPGIRGPRSLVVSSRGAMVGAIEQAQGDTVFAFQPGCRLRVKIMRPAALQAQPEAAE
jgi:hypothetical protein